MMDSNGGTWHDSLQVLDMMAISKFIRTTFIMKKRPMTVSTDQSFVISSR